MTKVLGIIPARLASTRLPNKPLQKINGKSLIELVWINALKCKEINSLVIATDHESIMKEAIKFGARVVMTSPLHNSGTDRCAQVAEYIGDGFDCILNIQGDEPFINPDYFTQLIQSYELNQNFQIGTLIAPFSNTSEVSNMSKVKCVKKINGEALYFSRSVIPFHRDQNVVPPTYYQHLGVYLFHTDTLKAISQLPTSVLEQSEQLEQLRWIENNFKITTITVESPSIGIDTLEDLEQARQFQLRQTT